MSELHRITFNPEQNSRRPSIRGMRIRVTDVLELLASGASREEILDDYPYLKPEDITAALQCRLIIHLWAIPDCARWIVD